MQHEQDLIRIRHILDAAQEIVQYTVGKTRDDLETDRPLQHLLLHNIAIIGEAASKIDTEFRSQYPEFPWPQMIGIRNRVVHAYFDINLNIIWQTATQNLPPIIPLLKKLLEERN